MVATRSQSLLKEAMMNETKEFLESRLENLKETIDDPNAKIGERIHALLLLLRSGKREEENLHVHAYAASSQLPESPDFNRPEPKPNYVIKATSDVTEASSPLPNHTIKRQQRISLEEIDERRLKGLCLFCEESETPDHYLRHKNSGILMIDCDEDQSCDDEELVEMEAATESNGIEVNNQRQFQVPVSDSESLRSIEPGKVDLGLENQEHVVMNDNLEQEWVQKNISKRFEVDVDVDRDQKVTSNTQIGSRHQMLDKMPLRVRSKMKRGKCPKCWRFKFKNRDLRGYNLSRVKFLLKNSFVITGFWRWFMMVNRYEQCHMLEHANIGAESFPILNFAEEQPLLGMQNNSKQILIVSELESGQRLMRLLFYLGFHNRSLKTAYSSWEVRSDILNSLSDALIEAKFVKTMEEYPKNHLASTLAYELFHSPRPPELCVAERMIEEDMNKDYQKQQGDWACYHVWHRWKARCCFVGVISTMWAWLFGEEGFDKGKEMTRGGSGLKGNQWLRRLKTVVKKR